MNPYDLPTERIEDLVAEHGTPIYMVSRAKIVENYRRLDALPARGHPLLRREGQPPPGHPANSWQAGAGFDVASRGEIEAAVAAGADPREDLIFADTVKDPRHIAYAHAIGLDDFTFDNPSEITQIARHAPGRQRAPADPWSPTRAAWPT